MRYLALSLILVSSALGEAPVGDLSNGRDLTGWRTPYGTWSAVEAVNLDPANPKALMAQPGVYGSSSGDDLMEVKLP